MDILNFFDKLLSSNLVEKHIGIVFVAIIIIIANILNINIEVIKNIEYTPIIITLSVLIINAICLPSIFNKVRTLNETIDKYIKITAPQLDKEDFDIMISKLDCLIDDTKQVQNSIIVVNNQLKGIPNINTLNLLLTLRSKELWNDMFRECIKSVSNFSKKSESENFNKILIDTLKIELQKERVHYINFISERIIELPENNNLILNLTESIDNSINDILSQIDKNINDNNKLFLISLTLQNLERDLIDNTTKYLRGVQVFNKN